MASKSEQIKDVTGILVDANLQPSDFLIIAPVLVPMFFGAVLLMMRSRTNNHARIAIFGMALLVLVTLITAHASK